MKTFGLMLYGLAILITLLGVFAGWYVWIWGFHPAALFPVYSAIAVAALVLCMIGRIVRSR